MRVDLEGGGIEPSSLAFPEGPTPHSDSGGLGRSRSRSRSPVRDGQSLEDTVQSGTSNAASHNAGDITCDPGGGRRDRRTDRSRSPIRYRIDTPSPVQRQEIQMVPAPSSPLPDSVVGVQRTADPPNTPADNKRPRASSVSEVNLAPQFSGLQLQEPAGGGRPPTQVPAWAGERGGSAAAWRPPAAASART